MWRLPLRTLRCRTALRSVVPLYHYSSSPKNNHVQFDKRHTSAAYQAEFQKISILSKLINQSTPRGLEALEDVHEMMVEYTSLAAQDGVVRSISSNVTRALLQSARDCSVLLRKLPRRERDRITSHVYAHLKDYADHIAEDIIHKRAPRDLQTMGTLLALYELVDPTAGLVFFRTLGATEVTGSAMPCMIKAGCSLEEIKEAYNRASTKSDWVKAHMVRAYLEFDEPEAAIQLYDSIHTTNNKVSGKLDDLMIGEGPVDKAQEVFRKIDYAPRSPVMMRFLAHLWDVNKDLETQFKVFGRYLSLVLGTSEAPLIGPTQVVVQHIFAVHAQNVSELEKNIKRLARTYEKKTRAHTMLLNVILTELSRSTPTELDLAAKIMIEYGVEHDPVSYRVRLNALESVTFAEKKQLIHKLWNSRMAADSPLSALDWIALGRADNFGDTFHDLWEEQSRPFEKDIRNFQRSLARG